ncbi:MAG TPA: rod-binding protein, partial [bacterium]|nr:rod-binding protein [bacterium]
DPVSTREIFGAGFSGLSERERVQRAARELESVVVANLLSAMRKTVPSGGLFEESASDEIFRSMLDTELSRACAEKSPFGLADAVMKSMEKKLESTGHEEAPAAPPPAGTQGIPQPPDAAKAQSFRRIG